MNRHAVRGRQRIGDHDHARSALAHAGQQGHAILSRHEVRRDEEQLALRLVDDFAQLGREVRLVFAEEVSTLSG